MPKIFWIILSLALTILCSIEGCMIRDYEISTMAYRGRLILQEKIARDMTESMSGDLAKCREELAKPSPVIKRYGVSCGISQQSSGDNNTNIVHGDHSTVVINGKEGKE